MGSRCSCLANTTSNDEAEDALLGVVNNEERLPTGPPPPYQIHPFYMLTEEQRLQIVTRLALIQSLPVGHYNDKAFCELNTGDTCSLRKGSDKIEGKRECPICMNDFLPGQSIRLLPCMHFYHIHCIDDWLMRALTCPTCIQRVDSFNHHPIRRNSLYRRSSSDSSSTTNYSNSSSTERLTELSSTQHVTAEVY